MTVKLWQGRGYEGCVNVPRETDPGQIVQALEALGFEHVSARWVGESWRVRGVWSRPSVEVEPPPTVTELKQLQPAKEKRSQPKREPAKEAAKEPPAESQQKSIKPRGAPGVGQLGPVSHQQARALLLGAWAIQFPSLKPTASALQAIQAVALHETGYGRGWKNAMANSHNQGAIQCGKLQNDAGECDDGCAPYGDSRPTPQGQVKYGGCFKVYPSDEEGWLDLLRVMGRKNVRQVWDSGDLDAVAKGMRDNGYFGGMCASRGPSPLPPCKVFTPTMAAAQYANALEVAVLKIARGLGEQVATKRSGKLGEVPATGPDGQPIYRNRAPLRGGVHLMTATLLISSGGLLSWALGENPW